MHIRVKSNEKRKHRRHKSRQNKKRIIKAKKMKKNGKGRGRMTISIEFIERVKARRKKSFLQTSRVEIRNANSMLAALCNCHLMAIHDHNFQVSERLFRGVANCRKLMSILRRLIPKNYLMKFSQSQLYVAQTRGIPLSVRALGNQLNVAGINQKIENSNMARIAFIDTSLSRIETFPLFQCYACVERRRVQHATSPLYTNTIQQRAVENLCKIDKFPAFLPL